MAIKYHIVLYAGLAIALFMLVFVFVKYKKTKKYAGGKKIAGLICQEDEAYFRKRKILYKTGLTATLICCVLVVVSAFLLMAKPYTSRRMQDEKYCRDIILCIDISTSVDYLNENLLDKLKKTVDELQGERFGIVIFNTSPVLLTPLTDDYEYVKDQLDLIAQCLKSRNEVNLDDAFSSGYDWIYYQAYISSGTLIGNEQRGSSLIGDGLAAAAIDFSDADKERTKVVIFSTDNDIQGTPVATLDEAADICVSNNVTVYGVGTKEMTPENKESMKNAVEKTGGKFYLEEESGSFGEIVSSIEKLSKNLVKVRMVDVETPELLYPFVLMLVLFAGMLGTWPLAQIIRRYRREL